MVKPLEEKRQLICEECEHYQSCSSHMFYFGESEIAPNHWFVQEAIDIINEKETTGSTRGLENISAKGFEALKIVKTENAKKQRAKYGK